MNLYVFQATELLKDLIINDYKSTGQCKLQIAKEGFMQVWGGLALAKHSPYTDVINKG